MVLVAETGRGVVGMVTVGSRRHFTGEVDAYLGELAVAEGHTRHGVGTQLVRAAERWAGRSGYTRVTLEAGAANHAARRFYAALGYQEEDVRLTKTISADLGPNPQ